MMNTKKIFLFSFVLLTFVVAPLSVDAGSIRIVPFGYSNSSCVGSIVAGAGTYRQREDAPLNNPNISGTYAEGSYDRATPYPSGFSANPQNFCFEVNITETTPNGNTSPWRTGTQQNYYVPYTLETGTWHSGSSVVSMTPTSNYTSGGLVRRHASGSAAATFRSMYCEDTYSPQICSTSQSYSTYNSRTCTGGTEILRRSGTQSLVGGQSTGTMTSLTQAQALCTQNNASCCSYSTQTVWQAGEAVSQNTTFIAYSGNTALANSSATNSAIKLTNNTSCTGGNVTTTCVSPTTLPTVTLVANPSSISKGGSSTLTWTSQNALSCTGTNFNALGNTSGSVSVSPSATTNYSVTCTGYTQTPSSSGSGSTPGVWQYSGSDVSDIFCFNGCDPNNIYRGVPDCRSSNPAGTSCTTSDRRCKVNSTGSSIVTTDLYNCVGASSGNTNTGSSSYPTVSASARVTVTGTTCPQNDPNCPGTGTTPGGTPGGSGSSSCTDGADNDGDGYVDSSDPDCNRAGGNETVDNRPECSDTRDNDGDGRIDYPEDRACPSPLADDETAPDAILNLSAFPNPTRKDTSTSLSWEVVFGHSCVLSGNNSSASGNGDYWILAGTSGSQISSPLSQESVFTLRCLNLDDVPFSVSSTVKLLPSFKEQ